MRRLLSLSGAVLVAALAPSPALAQVSQCYGWTGQGRLDNGVRLPLGGTNFSAYSKRAVAAGRTYVHSQVADIVVGAYARLAQGKVSAHYVYGETGLASGGPFKPHKTHQNGLSVDFFVPVRDGAGRAAVMPTESQARLGYDIEFDKQGRYQDFRIDFAALAEHLHALQVVAQEHGVGIKRVIIDTDFLPQLLATPRGPWLKRHTPFMMGKPWVRHDEHFHVDFSLPCKP